MKFVLLHFSCLLRLLELFKGLQNVGFISFCIVLGEAAHTVMVQSECLLQIERNIETVPYWVPLKIRIVGVFIHLFICYFVPLPSFLVMFIRAIFINLQRFVEKSCVFPLYLHLWGFKYTNILSFPFLLQAKNGIQDMKCCSLEPDWIYFHPDMSGRIIHVGPNLIKYDFFFSSSLVFTRKKVA